MATDPVHLTPDALARMGATLSDQYQALSDERPTDPRCSLTGNMLAFVFQDGLTPGDEWMLRAGREDRVQEFRRTFFEVIDERLVAIVVDLTGFTVTSSFYGFDPQTRSTHAIFMLDLTRADGADERLAVRNWSEQVRRNARRLRAEHVANREVHRELQLEVRQRSEALRRKFDA